MNIIIVGGRKLTYFLARTFVSKGYPVTIINRDHEVCTWLARRLKATVVCGDGSDPRVLEDAGAETADVVLAATPYDEDNLVICQLAQVRFHVPRILAVVNDPENEEVMRQLGITDTVAVTHLLSSMIEQRVDSLGIANLIPVGEGKINVTELTLEPGSPVVGKALSEVRLPENSLVACVLRQNEPIVPRGTTVLAEQDRLIVMTTPKNHGHVLKLLTGEERD